MGAPPSRVGDVAGCEMEHASDILLQTTHLDLRALRESDREAFVALNGAADVMRFIGDPFSAERANEWLDQILAADTLETGLGWWATVDRESGALAGLVALKRFSEGNHAALGDLVAGARDDELMEIGWRFFPRFWGRGFASESGRALVAQAFEKHGFPRICAVALADNKASCRAIEKCGLRFENNYDFKGHRASFFVLRKEDHRSSPAC